MCAKIHIVALWFGLCHMEEFVKINHRLGVCRVSILFFTASLASSCSSPHNFCLCTECHSAKQRASACAVHAPICSLQVERVQSFIGRNDALDYLIPRSSYCIRWTFCMILSHMLYQDWPSSCFCLLRWEVQLRICPALAEMFTLPF